jgi:hypothetical protein
VRSRVLLVLIAAAAALVPTSPTAVERWYSMGVYPRLQSLITPATNLVPVAILDVVAAAALAVGAVTFIRRMRADGIRRALLRTGVSALCFAAAVYLLFLGLWGLNYRRLPLERKLDYERSRVTREAAISLANAAASFMNAGYAAAHRTAPDTKSLERSFDDVQRTLGAGRVAVPGVPKRSLLTWYFRGAAIDGMTDPLFLEIIVNPDVLDIERPFVLSHEWAHLAGYADESEANFVAWLTCVRGDGLARYSGWAAAYQHAAGALPREIQRTLTPLDPGPRDDMRAMELRYSKSSPVVRRAARDVYDGYLKANRVAEGIGSYDAVLRLMLGTRFNSDWTPARQTSVR